MLRHPLVGLLLCLCTWAYAQQIPSPDDVLANVDGDDFFEIQEALNNYFDEYPEAIGEKHWKRLEWFLEPRLYPTGKMDNLALLTMREYRRYMSTLPDQRATHGNWSFIGPINTTTGRGQGRINCVKIHPTNTNIIYVGSPSGGIWKSINGGSSWVNISPEIPMSSICDIELDPDNSNIVYALTGDGDPRPGTVVQTRRRKSRVLVSSNPLTDPSWAYTKLAMCMHVLAKPS